MAYTRKLKQGEQQPEQKKPERPTRTWDFKLTRTDRLFEDSDPGYYIFNEQVLTRECLVCDKEFKTHLKLLKTCSPKHYDALTDKFAGVESA